MNELLLTAIKKEDLSSLIETSIRKVLAENQSLHSNKESPPRFLNIDEASKFINLAKATVYTLSSSGKIPVIKKSKRLYFKEDDLVQWLNKGRRKTNEEIKEDSEKYVNDRRFSSKK